MAGASFSTFRQRTEGSVFLILFQPSEDDNECGECYFVWQQPQKLKIRCITSMSSYSRVSVRSNVIGTSISRIHVLVKNKLKSKSVAREIEECKMESLTRGIDLHDEFV